MASNSTTKEPTKEYLFKVLVIGDLGTGKTSYIKRYVHNTFSTQYRATIGVDFALKVLQLENGSKVVRLQLWDIAGQERFGQMTRVYYKEAVGCIVVYDVMRRSTFDSAIKWKEDLDSKVRLHDGRKIPCILLGSKKDELKRSNGTGCNDSNMESFCEQHGFIGWQEVSALDGENVDVAANILVTKILEQADSVIDNFEQEGDGPIVLEPGAENGAPPSKSCC